MTIRCLRWNSFLIKLNGGKSREIREVVRFFFLTIFVFLNIPKSCQHRETIMTEDDWQTSPDGSTEMSSTTDDNGGLHISMRCTTSKLPFTRSTPLGMFCSLETCACEQKSLAFFGGNANPSPEEMLTAVLGEDMMKMLSI